MEEITWSHRSQGLCLFSAGHTILLCAVVNWLCKCCFLYIYTSALTCIILLNTPSTCKLCCHVASQFFCRDFVFFMLIVFLITYTPYNAFDAHDRNNPTRNAYPPSCPATVDITSSLESSVSVRCELHLPKPSAVFERQRHARYVRTVGRPIDKGNSTVGVFHVRITELKRRRRITTP